MSIQTGRLVMMFAYTLLMLGWRTTGGRGYPQQSMSYLRGETVCQ